MIQDRLRVLVVLLFAWMCAGAQTHPVYTTQEAYRRSGYDYYWSLIQAEHDQHSFENEEDAENYRSMLDDVVRTASHYGQPFLDHREGVSELYPRLLRLDPDPPLYIQFLHLSYSSRNDKAYAENAEKLVTIAERMQGAGYPSREIALAKLVAAEFYRNAGMESNPNAVTARSEGIDLAVQACTFEDVPPEYQEFVSERLASLAWEYPTLTESDKDLYCELLLSDQRVDPWVANYTVGCRFMSRAWEIRGTGFAHTVSQSQWDRFNEYMVVAHNHLDRAWELRPEWPQAAKALMDLERSTTIDPQRNVGYWFQQATQYRVDFDGAYLALMQALLPRWGGSQESMYALLDHVLELSEEHSNMLYIAMAIMGQISRSTKDLNVVLLDERYLSELTQIMRQELRTPTQYISLWQRRVALRTLAMAHFELANYEVSAELLRAGGGMCNELYYPWSNSAGFSWHAPLLATGASDDVVRILRDKNEQSAQQQIDAYREVLSELEKNPPSGEIVGDPIGKAESRIDHLLGEIAKNRTAFYKTGFFRWASVAGVLVLLVSLVLSRLRGSGS